MLWNAPHGLWVQACALLLISTGAWGSHVNSQHCSFSSGMVCDLRPLSRAAEKLGEHRDIRAEILAHSRWSLNVHFLPCGNTRSNSWVSPSPPSLSEFHFLNLQCERQLKRTQAGSQIDLFKFCFVISELCDMKVHA